MILNESGWCSKARVEASPNHNARPQHEVSLLVIHNISLPPGEFGGDGVIKLFTNTLNGNTHSAYQDLKGLKVSSHFWVRRTGEVVQFVSTSDRAWHAGVSAFEGRQNCNDFALGIELEGTDERAYTPAQYDSLVALTKSVMACYPAITKARIVGHSDIAPGRKTDPGRAFDWGHYKGQL
jgi:AmpD protein